MAKNISGSIRKVTLDGVTYNAAADANLSATGSAFENSGVAHSGGNMRKMVRRVKVVDGVTLIVNASEQDQLEVLAGRPTDFPISYETADGSVFRCTGWIEYEKVESEENRASVKMFPRVKWSSFVAA